MGLFDKLFSKKEAEAAKEATTVYSGLTLYRPAFTSWNGKLYESELVRAAIDARARAAAKLKITVTGSAQPSFISSFKTRPNSLQTFYQFFYRASTILDMENNCIFVPERDKYGQLRGFFPIAPEKCEVVEIKKVLYLRYTFADRKMAAVPMSQCFIMTKHQYKNDFFGANNNCMHNTMELMDLNEKAIAEAVKNSSTYRFIAKATNLAKDEDLKKSKKRFMENNMTDDGGGILLFPSSMTDIKQVESSPFVVDPKEIEIIRTNVFDYFGVNEDILQNKATPDQYSAFYEGATEGFSIQFSEGISNCVYTQREINTGNFIYATANRLQFMSNGDKRAVSESAADRGYMMIDEIREIWNLPPLPNGAGQVFPHRGEYYYSKPEELPATEEEKETGTEAAPEDPGAKEEQGET